MKHLKVFIIAMILCASSACTKIQEGGNGQVHFEVASRLDVMDVTKSAVSDYTVLPSAGDFSITIKDSRSETVWSGKISEWLPSTLLTAGSYSVEASYGSLEEEGFDKPYFTGSQNFTVKGGSSVPVSIPVSLGNTIVKVVCSESFMNYYKDYTFKLTRNNAEVAVFEKGDTKAAFIDGYLIQVEGVLTSETKTQPFSVEYKNLEEATAYTLNFDAPNVGGSSITISFNDTVEEIELGNYELND